MIEKEWFDIPNYENIYTVNKKGEIKNLKGKILKPSINTAGYLKVALSNNKIVKYLMVHQILALTFLEGYCLGQRKFVVDHIDNNKLNNNLENLRIINFRENVSKDKKNCSSKYTGVSWSKISRKWNVYINLTGKNKFLGSFENEIDAANKYNEQINIKL